MSHDLTRVLDAAAAGDRQAAADLLPLVYDELRKLARARMAAEPPGVSIQATALVHEAYLRLLGGEEARQWDGRGHFFAAAAEAMRRILVDAARRRKRLKHGGGLDRVELDAEVEDNLAIEAPEGREDLVALDAALNKLQEEDAEAAQLVKLRYFVGMSMSEAATVLGISQRTAERTWTFAKAWLHREIAENPDES
jgi:RNA polymerase sigma factor (TIGR02999 family)